MFTRDIDKFFVSDGGILYTPSSWFDSTGRYRTGDEQFILTSRIRGGAEIPGYDGQGAEGFASPLNPPNLEDIFAKLPDMPDDHPVRKKIIARIFELEMRRKVLSGAERMKLDHGVGKRSITGTRTEEYEAFLFTDENGNGYGPSFTREREVEFTEVIERTMAEWWDGYSPPGRSFYYQQRAALEIIDVIPKMLLAMEQRTGKTGPLVTAARHKYEQGLIKLVLIVSTRRLLYTAWTDEMHMYWPEAGFTILKDNKSREDIVDNHYPVAMTSFESMGKNWPLIRRLYDPSEVMIIADETIKLKSPEASRTQSMIAACSEVHYAYLLSGAPVSRLHSDVFPQLMCVDPGLFGLNYNIAMDFFFMFLQDGGMRFRKGRKALFHSIADLGIWRCTRGEAQQFQGRETTTINERIKFDPLQAMLYKDLAYYMAATLEDDEVSASVKATNILVQLGRLREICGGFISYEYAPGKYERIRLPNNPKIDWLREYFTENEGSRAVIFCEYNEEEAMIADLLDELGIPWGGQLKVTRERKAGYRYGNNDHHFKQHMDEFQALKRQVFLGKHSSIGHGLTLNTAEIEIFYSLGFNSDNYDQARMRAVGGDTGHVLVYHLMMGGSIEELKIYKALSNRQDMKAAVLKDLDRSGYSSFFREITMEEILVDDKYREGHIDDMLEARARKILGYEGDLTVEALTEWMRGQGHGLFATIKEQIGSMGSLKQAFKRIAFNFHPDKAEAQGHGKDTPMYNLYSKIFMEATLARKESVSLGDFIQRIGGAKIEAQDQMWYDYLIRKAMGRKLTEEAEPLGPERRIA